MSSNSQRNEQSSLFISDSEWIPVPEFSISPFNAMGHETIAQPFNVFQGTSHDDLTSSAQIATFPTQNDLTNPGLSPLLFPSTFNFNSANTLTNTNGDRHPPYPPLLPNKLYNEFPAFTADQPQGSHLSVVAPNLSYDGFQSYIQSNMEAFGVSPTFEVQEYGYSHGVEHDFPATDIHDGLLSAFMQDTPTRQVVSTTAVTRAAERRRVNPHKFFCHVCPQGFTAKHNLDRHISAHYDDRPFECHCGSNFITNADLKRHQRRSKRHVPDSPHASGSSPSKTLDQPINLGTNDP
ncbi:hypothetical protein ONZ45_g9392 [Pleurotus djamor]|nr:hypothetical protein ONZ45_g9392 [Pleurotus djamor]